MKRALAVAIVGFATACHHTPMATVDASDVDAVIDATSDAAIATIDATIDAAPCNVAFAARPTIARGDDAITLEGSFLPDAEVTFSSGGARLATLLGSHRAVVSSSDARSGSIAVSCGPAALPLTRASFALGLGTFRSGQVMAAAHDSHTATVVGHTMYVIGGPSASMPMARSAGLPLSPG